MKFTSQNIKTVVSKSNTIMKRAEARRTRKANTEVIIYYDCINDGYAMLRVQRKSRVYDINLRQQSDGNTLMELHPGYVNGLKKVLKSQTELKSFISLFVYSYLVNNNRPLNIEIVASKTLCGVNMRLIRNLDNNMYAWVEANALVAACKDSMCNCINIKASPSGRIGTTNKIKEMSVYRVVGEGHIWHTLQEISEPVSCGLNNKEV